MIEPDDRGQPTSASVRVAFVGDDALLRKRMRSVLAAERDFSLVAEAAGGAAAVERLRRANPDLIFVDLSGGQLSCSEILAAFPEEEAPLLVLLANDESSAVEAFTCHAADFLIKPFDSQRLRSSLERARHRLELARTRQLNRHLLRLIHDLGERRGYLQRLSVKDGERFRLIDADAIEWVDAARNYVRLNSGGRTLRLRGSISDLEARLDPAKFVRIHRSTIVNMERIREIQPLQHGEHLLILEGGTRLTLSRSYRDRLGRLLR